MTFAFETTGLAKRYRRTWALRDCSLAVPRGRIAALVGPNGAGKTTLMRLAVGLRRPTRGSVRVFGHEPRDEPQSLARVGFVAQDTPLYRDLSVAEHLELGRRLNHAAWDAVPVRDRLAELQIPLDRRAGDCRAGNGRRSRSRSRWRSGPNSSCSTSRSRASIRWRGGRSLPS